MNPVSKILRTLLLLAIPVILLFFMIINSMCGFLPNGCPTLAPLGWGILAIFVLSIPTAFFIGLKSNKSRNETVLAWVIYVLPMVISVILFIIGILTA